MLRKVSSQINKFFKSYIFFYVNFRKKTHLASKYLKFISLYYGMFISRF